MTNNDAPAANARSPDAGGVALLKEVPKVGPFLAALVSWYLGLKASWRALIALVAFAVLVYPAVSFAIVLTMISASPKDMKSWIQTKVLAEFGGQELRKEFSTTEKTDINNTNLVIDGTSLLRFAVGGDGLLDNTYVVQLAPLQVVKFSTYQIEGADIHGNACKPVSLPPNGSYSDTPGNLVLKLVGYSHQETPDVAFNDQAVLTDFYKLDAVNWSKYKLREQDAYPNPAYLVVKFIPNRTFKFYGCTSFHVFVDMTYIKQSL